MGQKVSPVGLRVGVIRDWDAKWYADKDFAAFLHEDIEIRNFINTNALYNVIERVQVKNMFEQGYISSETATKRFEGLGEIVKRIESVANDVLKEK